MKTAEEPAGDLDIVAFGRRDLLTGSRVKDANPRFWWVSDLKTFSQALGGSRTSAGVLVLDSQSESETVRKVYARVASPKRKLLILVAEPGSAEVFADLLVDPMVAYLPARIGEARVEDTVEVMRHLALRNAVDKLQRKGILADAEATWLLFNPKSQRLDLKRVAKLFGLTVRRLAGIVGVPPSTADKTPDSKVIHEKLLRFEQIARGLAELDGDQDKFRRWLNTPNPELSDFTPLQVIEKGKADAVADMVSAALLGQPA